MSSTQSGSELLYKHTGLKNLDLDKLSTKQVELLEIQNKLYFYRKRAKNLLIKAVYTSAIGLVKLITLFEING